MATSKRGMHSFGKSRKLAIESLEQRALLTVGISIDDVFVDEDNGVATFTVELSESSGSTVSVDFDTADGTATTAGSDYTSKSVNVSFSPGQTSKTVDVTINNDSFEESDQTFKGQLSNASGGTITDAEGIATIIDNDAEGMTNTLDSLQNEGGHSLHAGNVALDIPIPSGLALRYNSITNADPIIVVETVQPDDSAVPDEIQAELDFGGVTTGTIYYDTTGLSAGDPLRFAFQVDASSLDSGTYEWTVTLTEIHGTEVSTRTFSGYHSIVNRQDSEFGNHWGLVGLDYLEISEDIVTLIGGDGRVIAAPRGSEGGGMGGGMGGGGLGEGGDGPEVGLIENEDGSFTYHYRLGGQAEFDDDGVLQEYVDRNGNATTYTYTSGLLTKITDSRGREATFTYSSGLLSQITGYGGEITTFTHNGNDQLTAITFPDPDGGGAQSAPVVEFEYDATTGLMTVYEDALNNETTFEYDFANRLKKVTFADDEYELFSPEIVQGLVDTGSGEGSSGNPADLIAPADGTATHTDRLGVETFYQFDWLGNTTSHTDGNGNTTTYERDDDGRVIEMTLPDPDGAGGLDAPVYSFEYDARGNMVTMVLPDDGNPGDDERVWEYDDDWNLATQYTDELGRITLYEIDEDNGNLLSMTQVVGQIDDPFNQETDDLVTTFTYTNEPVNAGDLPGGMILSVTDPMGVVATFTYDDDDQSDSFGRLESITTADGDSVEITEYFEFDLAGNRTAYIDAEGNRTDYTFDNLNRLTTVTLEDPDDGGPQSAPVWEYAYDAVGRRLSTEDPLGNTTVYSYDELGRLTVVTYEDPDGGGPLASPDIEYGYDEAGQLTSFTDALGNVTSYEYDDAGQLIEVTLPDPDGGGAQTSPVYSYEYDNLGRLISATDPLGNETTHTYNYLGQRIKTTLPDPDGAGGQAAPEIEFEYDLSGQLTSFTDALDRETTYEYDDLGRLVEMMLPDPDGGGAQTAPVYTYEYDDVGNLILMTDPLGNSTEYEYDELNRLIGITYEDPDDGGPLTAPEVTFTYDDRSLVTSITNPENETTSYEYDNLGRLITRTLPDPDGVGGQSAPEFSFEYNAVGLLTTQTDAAGNDTTYTYDNLHRLLEVTLPDPDGGGGQSAPEIEYEYDAAGRMVSMINPGGATTSFEYDNLGRRIKVIQPDPDGGGAAVAPEMEFAFDAVGNLISTTDPLDQTTTLAYDNLYRLISQTLPDPDGAGGLDAPETTFTYDAVGNRTSLTDPVGNTTTWAYDDLNRLTSETNELNDSRTYSYDSVGNLIAMTDRADRDREFTFDNLYRLIEEEWLDDTTTVRTIEFAYDDVGRLIGASDDDSSYTYTLDGLGRITETLVENSATSVKLTNTFDIMSNRTGLAAAIDSGSGFTDDFENTYTYDNLNRLTRLDQEEQSGGNAVAEKRVDFGYDDAGRLETIERFKDLDGGAGNEVATTTYSYDDLGRLTDLMHEHSTTTIADYDWEFDVASRVTQLSYSSLVGDDGTSDYTYDNNGQVTSADHDYQTDEDYSYDENGNRTNAGYTTGDNNQLTSDGVFNYTYDEEGNRLSRTRISNDPADDKTTEYEWDHANRLVGITYKDNSSTVTKSIVYVYDVFGRRIEKQVDADGAGAGNPVVTEYIYDGADIILALDDVGEPINRYLHGPMVDQILADEQVSSLSTPGDVLWLLTDNLGSVRDIVDSDGNVENHIVYDSFGNIVSETNSAIDTIYGFTGRERDEESDLQYNRARYYDASVGKWISEDPISFAGGHTNLASYVGNSPLNYRDPSGLIETGPEEMTMEEAVPAEAAQQQKTILIISGFEPFLGRGVNASAELAKRISTALNRPNVEVVIIPVDWSKPPVDKVNETIKTIRGNDPNAKVFWVGLGEGLNDVEFEKAGRNERGPGDDHGNFPGINVPKRNNTNPNAPAEVKLEKATGFYVAYNSFLMGKYLQGLATGKGPAFADLPFAISNSDAGGFICESLCYTIGDVIGSDGGIFIHVPVGFGLDPADQMDDIFVEAIAKIIKLQLFK